MIVEDERDQREALSELLSHVGHEVIMAATGRQALELVVSQSPALVLSDLALPDMDGRELLRRIRLTCPEPPAVVFITGKHPSQTADITGEVLLKPFSVEKLLTLVSDRIERRSPSIFDTGPPT